jgi:hypothetical protein
MVGWIKCHVGTGFYHDMNTTTAACCFHDSNRKLILAQTSWQQSKLSVIEGEGVTLFEAIKLAAQRRFDRVVFESDSQTLAKAIYAKRIGISKFSSTISCIKTLLSVWLNFEVKFCQRQGNVTCIIGSTSESVDVVDTVCAQDSRNPNLRGTVRSVQNIYMLTKSYE